MKKEPFNRIYTTIKNIDLVKDMEGLIASGKYGSKSEIIAKCVELAMPLLTGERTETNKSKNDGVDLIKKQSALLRELTVISNLTFNLLQSIFTERALTLEGKRTNAEDFKNGIYENLPEHYQAILSELLK